MKSLFCIFAAATFSVATSQAATINVTQGFTTNNGVVARTSTGTTLSGGGYYIALGSFTIVPTIVNAATDNGASLLAAVDSLNIFTTLTSPTAAGATQGSIVGAFTSIGAPDAALFNLKQMYFVIGNGATRASSTEYGIFSVTNTFPANVTVSGATAVTVGTIANITPLANAGSTTDVVGGKDTFTLVNPVPEPSAALLGALGALGLLRRRRN